MLTNRCNMRCSHCCYSCIKKGTDMTRETFVTTCKLAEDRGESIFLGGGEPTLHPLLFDFLGIANAYHTACGAGPVGLVTNGSQTDIALKLAAMAREGWIQAELSQDKFHDLIDTRVIRAFTREKRPYDGSPRDNDLRGVRSGANVHVNAHGRGKKIPGAKDRCCCEELVVDPNGKIFHCGCMEIEYGTVFNPSIPDEYDHECFSN